MPKIKDVDIKRLMQARIEAQSSKCCKHKVGCIITDINGRICGSGYNGAPHGMTDCDVVFAGKTDHPNFREDHRIWAATHEIHAEINALLHSDQKDYRGGTMYLTHPPCKSCALAIRAAGINTLVYIKKEMHCGFDPDTMYGMIIREYKLGDLDV